jgi:hypothetical protein
MLKKVMVGGKNDLLDSMRKERENPLMMKGF